MKRYFNSTIKTLMAFMALGLCASCSDVWDEHYSVDPSIVPEQSILQMLEANKETSEFVNVLKTTFTYNGKKRVDAVSYYDLLGADQFLTVWAPVNDALSAEEWAAYTKQNKTEEENFMTSQRFLKNHIARFNHPVGKDGARVTMMSTKRYEMMQNSIQHATYIDKNQPCSNGILHIIDEALQYNPNLYEYLTTDDQYKNNLGKFLESYTKYEINEEKSVAAGIVDGKTVYVDSVLEEVSILLDKFGYINKEDSTYKVVLPSGSAYEKAYEAILPRYDYAYVDKADSLQWFWANSALLTDAFFNMNPQEQPFYVIDEDGNRTLDWMTSTTFDVDEYLLTGKMYHFYCMAPGFEFYSLYNPDIVECSNGEVVVCDEWPFLPEETYDAPIVREAENAQGRLMNDDLTSIQELPIHTIRNYQYLEQPFYTSDISSGKILLVKGKQAITDRWRLDFDIYDNLAGYYNFYVVIVPNCINGDVVPPKPNPFTVELSWYDETGYYQSYSPKDGKRAITFENDPTKLDTVLVAKQIYIPVCNYGQPEAQVKLSMTCAIASNKISKYSNTMLLDCIIVEPTTAPEPEPEPVEE